MSDRAAREKTFWDEAYRVEGPAREKHLWSKFITDASYSEELFGALLGEGTCRALVAALGEARFFPRQRLPDAAQIPEHVRPHSSDEVAGTSDAG